MRLSSVFLVKLLTQKDLSSQLDSRWINCGTS